MGGVYGVGANGRIVRSPHQERSFSIQFGCAPDRVDELVAAAFREIDKVVAGPKKKSEDAAGKDKKDLSISDEDLDDYLAKVKETYIRERETQMRTNRFWVGALQDSYRFGDDPTLILDTEKIIARMTPANVRAAAKKFLDKKEYFQAAMLPEKDVPVGANPPAQTPAISGLAAECNEMLAAYDQMMKCPKLPADAKDAMKQAADQLKQGLEQLKTQPIDQQKAACTQARDAVKQSMAAMGC
jgi:hypothetical protein